MSPLRLEGPTLSLRPLDVSDWRGYKAVLGDPRTMRHLQLRRLLVRGVPARRIKERIAVRRKAYERGESVVFTAKLRLGGEMVGLGGFNRIDLEQRGGEFGLALLPEAWGKGIAAEFHLLGLEHGFKTLKLHRVEFITAKANVRMRAFFEKSGIRLESVRAEATRAGRRYTDQCVYVVFDRDWPKVKKRLLARRRVQSA